MLTYRTLFLFVVIELFPNCVFQLYCSKDYYKQKQWNTLPVTMITEITNFNRLLGWLPWHYLPLAARTLAILTNNFAQYNLFGANVYMCYDYVHLDNLSVLIETTTYSNVKCKCRKRHIRPKIMSILCTT